MTGRQNISHFKWHYGIQRRLFAKHYVFPTLLRVKKKKLTRFLHLKEARVLIFKKKQRPYLIANKQLVNKQNLYLNRNNFPPYESCLKKKRKIRKERIEKKIKNFSKIARRKQKYICKNKPFRQKTTFDFEIMKKDLTMIESRRTLKRYKEFFRKRFNQYKYITDYQNQKKSHCI